MHIINVFRFRFPQAYLTTENEQDNYFANGQTFQRLSNALSGLIERSPTPDRHSSGAPCMRKLIRTINKLASYDHNKKRLADAGVIKSFVRILQSSETNPEVNMAACGLWLLSFKCREDILNEPGCKESEFFIRELFSNSPFVCCLTIQIISV